MLMKKFGMLLISLLLVLTMMSGALAETVEMVCDGTANYKLQAEERDAGFDGNYVFAQYFGGTQEDMLAGIRELILAGKVTINGTAIPTDTADMEQKEDGTFAFVVNGAPSFTAETGADAETLAQAGLGAIANVVKSAGTNVSFELDENGKAESMSIFITRGALVDAIQDRGDGTSTLIAEGAPYAVSQGGGMMGGGPSIEVYFPNENIDENVAIGDIAVCYQLPDGWHLAAADKMVGYLVGGADHEDYLFKDLDGVTHYLEDADMYNRAFATQNRPGGFVNTQVNFKLTEGDFEVTAWFVPGTAQTEKPMIIGFTTGESARPRLEAAIAYAKEIADNAVVAGSREEAGEGKDWVEDQATIDTLREAISAAEAALADESLTPSAIDGAVYNLHLAIWGSMNDISAVFMGTAVEGFYDIANPDVEKTHVELK